MDRCFSSELAALFAFQEKVAVDAGVEVLVVAKTSDFAALDAWLKQAGLTPPNKDRLTVDPGGVTTTKLNSKRPLETMVFTKEGKLSSQAKGPWEWRGDAAAAIEKARGGATLE